MKDTDSLRCDLSYRPLSAILFDSSQPIALGAVLILMTVLQIRAGVPADPVVRLLLIAAFVITAAVFAWLVRNALLYEETYVRSIEVVPGESVTVEAADGVHSMAWSDVVFTVTYTSFFTMSIIFFSLDDYVVARMSNFNIFLKDTRRTFSDFYAIASYVKDNSPRNENVVISSRAERHPWIRFTRVVPDRDLYSPKARSVFDRLREDFFANVR